MSARALGRQQVGILQSLVAHRYWYGSGFGCGWYWSTAKKTQELLDGLVRRGLVTLADEQHGGTTAHPIPTYRPSGAGVAYVEAAQATRVAAKTSVVPAHDALRAARLLLDALTLDCRAISKAVDQLEGLAAQSRPAPPQLLHVVAEIGKRYRERTKAGAA